MMQVLQSMGKTKKKALTSNPFVVEFDYGTNKDGYWGYNYMVLQTEDCIDVLRACFDDMYDFNKELMDWM